MKDKDKKKTYARPDLKEGMTPEEEAQAIEKMSKAMVDNIFGKEFPRTADKKKDKGDKTRKEGKENG